jgi:hypothetical protein
MIIIGTDSGIGTKAIANDYTCVGAPAADVDSIADAKADFDASAGGNSGTEAACADVATSTHAGDSVSVSIAGARADSDVAFNLDNAGQKGVTKRNSKYHSNTAALLPQLVLDQLDDDDSGLDNETPREHFPLRNDDYISSVSTLYNSPPKQKQCVHTQTSPLSSPREQNVIFEALDLRRIPVHCVTAVATAQYVQSHQLTEDTTAPTSSSSSSSFPSTSSDSMFKKVSREEEGSDPPKLPRHLMQ